MTPTVDKTNFENPFRTSRLNHSSDFQPQWDVESLNAAPFDWLLREVKKASGRRHPDPGQVIPVLLSSAGYGKTHLFGRLAQAIGSGAFYVFVGAIPDANRPLEHIRWTLVETLFTANPGEVAPLEMALAELFHSSFVDGASKISEDDRQQILFQKLSGDISAVFEVVKQCSKMASFHKLAASTAARMPQIRSSVVRALVLGWSPQKHLARRWLRGEKLSEDEAQLLGLIDDCPHPIDVMKAVVAILDYRKPLIICCDQIDAMVKDNQGPKQLGIQLMEVLAGVPNLLITVSCLESAWHDQCRPGLSDAFLRRTREFRLVFPDQEQAVSLVSKRLATWPQREAGKDELWPFDRAAMEQFLRDEKPRPSVLISLCADAMDQWVEGKLAEPIPIVPGIETPKPPLPELFKQVWAAELKNVEIDPRRQPDEMQDARIFAALKEVMNLVKSSGEKWPGLRIQLVKEPVLASAASYPRYGMRIEIGDPANVHSVIAGVTTLTGGISLYYYIRELSAAIKTSAGGILLHPRREFSLGAVARRTVDKLVADGKLVVLPLEENRLTFNQLECVMSLLDQARSGELTIGSSSITYEKCQELLCETKVLEDAALFKVVSKWNTAPPQKAAATEIPPTAASKQGKAEVRSETAPLFQSDQPVPRRRNSRPRRTRAAVEEL